MHTHQGLKALFLQVCDDRKPERRGWGEAAGTCRGTDPPVRAAGAAGALSAHGDRICCLRDVYLQPEAGGDREQPWCCLPLPGTRLLSRAQLPGASAAPGVTVLHPRGQGKIRSFIFNSYLWVPAAGRKASGTESAAPSAELPVTGSSRGAGHPTHAGEAYSTVTLGRGGLRSPGTHGCLHCPRRTHHENLKCYEREGGDHGPTSHPSSRPGDGTADPLRQILPLPGLIRVLLHSAGRGKASTVLPPALPTPCSLVAGDTNT